MPVEPIAAIGRIQKSPPDDGSLYEEKSASRDVQTAQDTRVEELKKRDRAVKTHEALHKAAAGQYAVSGPTYDYVTGPDGHRYAVGGSVQLDTSMIADNPDATIQKMEQIKRAALAPPDPSGQDRAVAADATAKEALARSEKTIVEHSRRSRQGKIALHYGQANGVSGRGNVDRTA